MFKSGRFARAAFDAIGESLLERNSKFPKDSVLEWRSVFEVAIVLSITGV